MGTLKRIHVNRHFIAANRRDSVKRPVFTVKERGEVTYARRGKILGEAELIYRPQRPLACGAVAWVETRADVELDGAMTYQEAKNLA